MILLYECELPNGKKFTGSVRVENEHHAVLKMKEFKNYKPKYSNWRLYDQRNIVGKEPILLKQWDVAPNCR